MSISDNTLLLKYASQYHKHKQLLLEHADGQICISCRCQSVCCLSVSCPSHGDVKECTQLYTAVGSRQPVTPCLRDIDSPSVSAPQIICLGWHTKGKACLWVSFLLQWWYSIHPHPPSIQRRRSCGVEQFAAGHSYCINTVYFQKSAQDTSVCSFISIINLISRSICCMAPL